MAPFKKPSFSKPNSAPPPPAQEETTQKGSGDYERIGRGYMAEGKKGDYIKVMIDEGVTIAGGDYLFLFENKNKKGDKSPDFMVTRKAQ